MIGKQTEKQAKEERESKNYKQQAAGVYVVRAGNFGMNRVMNTRVGLMTACEYI